jgi:hypothetical protein
MGSDIHDSGHPGVVLHRFGKGKALYVSGDIGTAFSDHPVPRLRDFLSDLVHRADLKVLVDGPQIILASAFEVEGHKVNVHLYHRFRPMIPWDFHHWDAAQWASLDSPFPVHNIRLTFPQGIEKAFMPLRKLALTIENGSTVVVPEVYLHDVVQVTPSKGQSG